MHRGSCWPRFSMHTMLLVFVCLAFLCSWQQSVWQTRKIVADIERLGGTVARNHGEFEWLCGPVVVAITIPWDKTKAFDLDRLKRFSSLSRLEIIQIGDPQYSRGKTNLVILDPYRRKSLLNLGVQNSIQEFVFETGNDWERSTWSLKLPAGHTSTVTIQRLDQYCLLEAGSVFDGLYEERDERLIMMTPSRVEMGHLVWQWRKDHFVLVQEPSGTPFGPSYLGATLTAQQNKR